MPPVARRPAVLYTRDMEPVTVLDLQGAVWERLANGERVDLPVVTRPPGSSPLLPLRLSLESLAERRHVTLWAEQHLVRGEVSLLVFTDDESNALLLKSTVLPGQQGALAGERRRAFLAGMLAALNEGGT